MEFPKRNPALRMKTLVEADYCIDSCAMYCDYYITISYFRSKAYFLIESVYPKKSHKKVENCSLGIAKLYLIISVCLLFILLIS